MNEWFEPEWAGIRQVFCVHRQMVAKGKQRDETIYGLTSLTRKQASAHQLFDHLRTHWWVENRLHWQ